MFCSSRRHKEIGKVGSKGLCPVSFRHFLVTVMPLSSKTQKLCTVGLETNGTFWAWLTIKAKK